VDKSASEPASDLLRIHTAQVTPIMDVSSLSYSAHVDATTSQSGDSAGIMMRSLALRSSQRSHSTPLQLRSNTSQGEGASSPAHDSVTGDVATSEEGGLWGWTVVVGSSIIFFVTLGLVYSFGVLQAELIARHYASASTLGWVSSTTVVITPLLAVPITTLIRQTSNRFVALLGGLCTGFGYIATSYTFSSSVVYLFLAQSLFGLGYAFNFWSCNSLAGEYFESKRALAVGIVYGGSGLGGAVFSIGLSKLIDRLGLEEGVRIAGILALAILVPASMTLRKKKELKIAKLRL
jgi:hypothetical protein